MGEQQYQPPESREIRWTSPVAFGDANYNNHDENHCFCYYNWAVTKALEFASGHLETGAKSVNMDLEPRVATGLDLRNGAAGGYNFPLPAASPTSRDPKGHHPPQSLISGARVWLQTMCAPGIGLSEAAQTQGLTPLLKSDPERMDACPSAERVGLQEGQAWVSGELAREGPWRGGHWGKVPPVRAGTRGAEP